MFVDPVPGNPRLISSISEGRCAGKMSAKNGSNGARTHDLSRVRRTLIPAELYFRS